MKEKLLVSVLGHRNSGKSHTWNTLFGRKVRTGSKLRRLFLTKTEFVNVFLISGSPQERNIDVEKIMPVKNAAIVLCSLQYRNGAKKSLKYFTDQGYFTFLHWLNPGRFDGGPIDDDINIIDTIVFADSLFGIRNGKCSAQSRVAEMRTFIYGWAKDRGLLNEI